MTEKQQFENDLGKAEHNQTRGRKVLSFMFAINMRKLRNGSITQNDLTSILQDANLQTIERLLLNGSLESARSMIVNGTFEFYNSGDKEIIIGVIDNDIFTDY